MGTTHIEAAEFVGGAGLRFHLVDADGHESEVTLRLTYGEAERLELWAADNGAAEADMAEQYRQIRKETDTYEADIDAATDAPEQLEVIAARMAELVEQSALIVRERRATAREVWRLIDEVRRLWPNTADTPATLTDGLLADWVRVVNDDPFVLGARVPNQSDQTTSLNRSG